MLTPIATPAFRKQRGISLIEALVAIVVMTLGILGILGVQMRTLTDTQISVKRAQAIRLIEDLSERLQNNPDPLNNLSAYTSEATSASPDCATTMCAAPALAAFDTVKWREKVSQAFPGGQIKVFIPKDSPRQLGVLLGWRENRYNASGKEATSDEASALNSIFDVSGQDASGDEVTCESGLICHLHYLQPTQRCTPWGGILYCPN